MKVNPLLCVASLSFVGLTAHAQGQAPGLWESTMTIKSQDGQIEKSMAAMQKQLAAMPADQRAQIEAAMSKSGVKIGANGTTVKACITKEQAAHPEPHMPGRCTTSDLQRTSNSMKFKFACSPPQPYSGEGEWTFTSDRSYTGHMTSTGDAGGKSPPMSMDMTGKWLSSDCGDVTPFVMPPK